MKHIGCFVSSHGFGHATRVSAVLESLAERIDITPHIFTTVDEALFAQTLDRYRYYHQLTDIGFVQDDAFHIDIAATGKELRSLLPYRDRLIDTLAEKCRDCSFILCDISGLGIKVAEKIAIPSILLENFTWPWLYAPYRQRYPDIAFYADYLAETLRSADHHIQTEPLCVTEDSDLHCGPIFRKTRQERASLRNTLQCGSRRVVLISLGGLGFSPGFLDQLKKYDNFFFLFGGQEKELRLGENVQFLDRFSKYYHPDLIGCADIVVFKSGYSTLAECYQCGSPSICIQRNGFAESRILEDFAEKQMHSRILAQSDFLSGKWLLTLSDMSLRGNRPATRNGADDVAEFLLSLLG